MRVAEAQHVLRCGIGGGESRYPDRIKMAAG